MTKFLLRGSDATNARIGRVEFRAGGRCPVCSGSLATEATRRCIACDTSHHAACWRWSGGCSTYGCSERAGENRCPASASSPAPRSARRARREAFPFPEPDYRIQHAMVGVVLVAMVAVDPTWLLAFLVEALVHLPWILSEKT